MAAAIPAATGLFGLYQAGQQQRGANRLQNEGLGMERERHQFGMGISRDILERALAYDPAADTQAAVDYASKTTGDTLAKALKNLNATYRAGGGTPSGDTEFNVSAQGTTNRVTDPLRQFAANRKSMEFMLKIQALQAALGGAPGGGAADAFMRAAQMQQGNFGGATQMLGGALSDPRFLAMFK